MRSSDPLTVGIVGCGNMLNVVHLPLILETERFRVTALCDARPEQLAAAAALVPDARRYADCDSFADRESPDVLVVVVAPQALAGVIAPPSVRHGAPSSSRNRWASTTRTAAALRRWFLPSS